MTLFLLIIGMAAHRFCCLTRAKSLTVSISHPDQQACSQTLQQALQELATKKQDNWNNFINRVLSHTEPTSKQKSKKFVPFGMVYCR